MTLLSPSRVLAALALLAALHLASANKVQDALDAFCASKKPRFVARFSRATARVQVRDLYCFDPLKLDYREFSKCVQADGKCFSCAGAVVGFHTDAQTQYTAELRQLVMATSTKNQAFSCTTELQDDLDAYCHGESNNNVLARYDTGDWFEAEAKWRCYNPADLDFQVDGMCVDNVGRCVACKGARTRAVNSHINRNVDLLALISAKSSKQLAFQCAPTGPGPYAQTPMQQLNYLCYNNFNQRNSRGQLSYMVARFGNTPFLNDKPHWQCMRGAHIEPRENGVCITPDGDCTECAGAPVRTEASCLALKQAGLDKGNGLYDISIPDGRVLKAYCVFDSDGTYTHIPCDQLSGTGACTATSTASGPNTCKDFGLGMLVIRTKSHLTQAVAQFDPKYFKSAWVTSPKAGRYTTCAMRDPRFYPDGCADWTAFDGGKWWMRDTPYSEPNGDYQPGCFLRTRVLDPNNYTFNDANTCASSETASYICSTNDYDPAMPFQIPSQFAGQFLNTTAVKPETDELLALIKLSTGNSIGCQENVQQKLDDYCHTNFPLYPYARFDIGTDSQRALRCHRYDSLGFGAEGLCVGNDGSCTPCLGKRKTIGTATQVDAEAALKGIVMAETGSAFTCTPTLQHQLDDWCLMNDPTRPFARTAGEFLSCYAASELITRTAQACVSETGTCGACLGEVRTNNKADPANSVFLEAIVAQVAKLPFQCNLQSALDNLCRAADSTKPFARYARAGWACFALADLDFQAMGLCSSDGGTCQKCMGKIRATAQGTPNDQAVMAEIATIAGQAFGCSFAFQDNTTWTVSSFGEVEDFVRLLENGVVESSGGSGSWGFVSGSDAVNVTVPSAAGPVSRLFDPDSTEMTFEAGQLHGDGALLTVGVVDGAVTVGGSQNPQVKPGAGPAIVQGPLGDMDALLFTGTQGIELSAPIQLGLAYTIDLYFKLPIPKVPTSVRWHTLLRGPSDHHLLIPADESDIGTYDNVALTRFNGFNVQLDSYAAGWHRLTAVVSGGGTLLYIDGQAAGDGGNGHTPQSAVQMIGTHLGRDQPWGYMWRLAVHALVAPPESNVFLAPSFRGTLVDPAALPALPGTKWSWEPEAVAGPAGWIQFLTNGILNTAWGTGSWESDGGQYVAIWGGVEHRLQLLGETLLVGLWQGGPVGQEVRLTARGRLLAQHIDVNPTSNGKSGTFVFPPGVDRVLVKLWGAGGSGGFGGAGAFASAVLSTSSMPSVYYVVGATVSATNAVCPGGQRTWVGPDRSSELLIAAGGGGSRTADAPGGPGGALVGGDGRRFCTDTRTCIAGGSGGTQTTPGLSGGGTSDASGGTPGKSTQFQACSGGAGLFGGGQGAETWGAGGGGSSFADARLATPRLIGGRFVTGAGGSIGTEAGNPTDPDRGAFGLSSAPGDPNSRRGRVVFVYDEAEIARAEAAALKLAVLQPGSAFNWTESDGSSGSLLLFENGVCEFVLGATIASGQYEVDFDGHLTVTVPHKGTYAFTVAPSAYRLVPVASRLNHASATLACEQKGMTLAIVKTAEQQAAVASACTALVNSVPAPVPPACYIGLQKDSVSGPWRWADGTPYDPAGELDGFVEPEANTRSETVAAMYIPRTPTGWHGYGVGDSTLLSLCSSVTSASETRLAGANVGNGVDTVALSTFPGLGPASHFKVFDTPGRYLWAVPPGVNEVRVKAWGAGGDTRTIYGGYVRADVIVKAGEELEIIVGDFPASAVRTTAVSVVGLGQVLRAGSGQQTASVTRISLAARIDATLNVIKATQARIPMATDPDRGRAAERDQSGRVVLKVLCPAGYSDYHASSSAPCWPCRAGTYARAQSQGDCELKACAAGSYDHDSRSDTPCRQCPAETFQAAKGRTTCTNMTVCAPGSGVAQGGGGSSSADRVCEQCVAGATFSTAQNAACAPVTACAAGLVETAAPTRTSDRQCSACPAGAHLRDGLVCTRNSRCPRGAQELMPPTATSDRTCEPCPAGTFSANETDSAQCTAWSALCQVGGEWLANTPSATEDRDCRPLTACLAPGSFEFELTLATATSDRVCGACTKACPSGAALSPPCSPTSDGVCAACAQCVAGAQFQSTPCTTTAAGTCAACAVCNPATQWTAAPCKLSADAVCAPLTVCLANEYERVAPTPFANRRCDTLTRCGRGEYELRAATATSDRVCAPLAQCQPGEYSPVAATPTSDRSCRNCPAGSVDADSAPETACVVCAAGSHAPAGTTLCQPCDAGTADLDSDPATPCQPCTGGASGYQPLAGQTQCLAPTGCALGFEELVASTPFADRLCAACPAGVSYRSQLSQPACQPVTVCQAGEAEVRAPTASADRLCQPCVLGQTYADTPSLAACKPVSACQAGEFASQAPTVSSDRVCRPLTVCPAGQFEGRAPAPAASPVTDRVCLNCTVCPANHAETRACSAAADAVCTGCGSCGTGFYKIAATCVSGAQDHCRACSDCGALNTFEASPCSADLDAVCQGYRACKIGEYEQTPGTRSSDRVCAALTICSSSEYESRAAGPSSDRACAPLATCDPALQYEASAPTATSNRACAALTVCDATEYQSAAPNPLTDRVCRPISTCSGTEYQSRAATRTSDRRCLTVRECIVGVEYETRTPTGFRNRLCARCVTTCPAGAFLQGTCTVQGAIPPVVCQNCTRPADCALGEFLKGTCTVGGGDATCSSCKTCIGAEFEASPCTATSDRVCQALTQCDSSQVATAPTGTSDRQCRSATTCRSDQYEVQKKTTTTDRVCANLQTCITNVEFQAQAPSTTSNRVCKPFTICTSAEWESQAPTATSDRVCLSLTVCVAEAQYELLPAAVDSDRRCMPVTVCGATQYQVVAPTTTSDRVCTALRVCTSTEYEHTRPSALSDRICLPLRPPCAPGTEYQALPATATSDRVCRPVTTCDLDLEYSALDATATSDTVCVPLTPSCSPATEFEQVPKTRSSDRVCTPLTMCDPATQLESVSATATSDRQCDGVGRFDTLNVTFDADFDQVVPTQSLQAAFALAVADEFRAETKPAGSDPGNAHANLNIQVTLFRGSIVARVVALLPGAVLDAFNTKLEGSGISVAFRGTVYPARPYLDASAEAQRNAAARAAAEASFLEALRKGRSEADAKDEYVDTYEDMMGTGDAMALADSFAMAQANIEQAARDAGSAAYDAELAASGDTREAEKAFVRAYEAGGGTSDADTLAERKTDDVAATNRAAERAGSLAFLAAQADGLSDPAAIQAYVEAYLAAGGTDPNPDQLAGAYAAAQNGSPKSDSNSNLIIYVVVAVVGVLLLALVIAFLVRRSRRSNNVDISRGIPAASGDVQFTNPTFTNPTYSSVALPGVDPRVSSGEWYDPDALGKPDSGLYDDLTGESESDGGYLDVAPTTI